MKFNNFSNEGYSIKKVSGGGVHTPQKILRVGGLENFAILWVGDPGNFQILRVVWSDPHRW